MDNDAATRLVARLLRKLAYDVQHHSKRLEHLSMDIPAYGNVKISFEWDVKERQRDGLSDAMKAANG